MFANELYFEWSKKPFPGFVKPRLAFVLAVVPRSAHNDCGLSLGLATASIANRQSKRKLAESAKHK